jgi:hypothetical protein
MRQLRFIAIGLVTFLFVTSAIFPRKIIAVFLCGVLSFNSAVCYSSLDDYGKADAAVSSSRTILAQNSEPSPKTKPSEAKKPDASDYDFSVVAKFGDVVDGRKIFSFLGNDPEKYGFGYNAIDDNGHVVYPILESTDGSKRQLIRDNKAVAYVGQKIDNFVVSFVNDHIFCRNGNLDIKLFVLDSTGVQKEIITRNGKVVWINDKEHNFSPFSESYFADTCNITTLYSPFQYKYLKMNSTPILKSRYDLSPDFKIPYAKLLGFTPTASLLLKADVNDKGDVLLLVYYVDSETKSVPQMLILVKPKNSKNQCQKFRGYFTANAENESRDHKATVPCNDENCASGVTIGYGYDMGSRTAKEITEELKSIGLSQEAASLYSQAAGLKGNEANQFIKDHKNSLNTNENLVVITDAQALKLFERNYEEKEANIQRIIFENGKHVKDFKDTKPSQQVLNKLARQRNLPSEKIAAEFREQYKKALKDFKDNEWSKLDERMREVIVDLHFQGAVTYKDTDLFKYFENNDLSGFQDAFKKLFSKDGKKYIEAKEGSRRFCLRLKKLNSKQPSDCVDGVSCPRK